MSSTNMGRTAGSSGRASAEPIISRVIPCNTRKTHEQTQSLPMLTLITGRPRNPCCPNTSEQLTFFSWMFPHSSSWNEDFKKRTTWLQWIQHWDGAFVVVDVHNGGLRNWPIFCLANKSILIKASVMENDCTDCFIFSLLRISEFWGTHSDSRAVRERVRGDRDGEDVLQERKKRDERFWESASDPRRRLQRPRSGPPLLGYQEIVSCCRWQSRAGNKAVTHEVQYLLEAQDVPDKTVTLRTSCSFSPV